MDSLELLAAVYHSINRDYILYLKLSIRLEVVFTTLERPYLRFKPIRGS